jgi:hypothetical protein
VTNAAGHIQTARVPIRVSHFTRACLDQFHGRHITLLSRPNATCQAACTQALRGRLNASGLQVRVGTEVQTGPVGCISVYPGYGGTLAGATCLREELGGTYPITVDGDNCERRPLLPYLILVE